MWISLSDAFLSIVALPNHPDIFKVRARCKGDIEKVFPDATPRSTVSGEIAASLEAIDYNNFKNSVRDDRLHSAYASV